MERRAARRARERKRERDGAREGVRSGVMGRDREALGGGRRENRKGRGG